MADWPHSPVHRFSEGGTYIATTGTYLKKPLFRGSDRLRYLCQALLEFAQKCGWELQAWAVFPNHYHFVGLAPAQGTSLTQFIKNLHSATAIEVNQRDKVRGRKA